MRRLVLSITFAALAVVMLVSEAMAGSCPIRADSLEAFAGCMAPMRGTIGTTTVYSSGKYDRDNAQLMSAMMRSNVVPQQVIPPSVTQTYPYGGYFSPASYMNLYFAGHSSYRNNWFRFASFYSPYYRSNPNMWVSAYYAY
jgi:hypothetical protein